MGFYVIFKENKNDDKPEYYDSDACVLYLSPDRVIEITDNSKIIFDYLIINRNSALSRNQILNKIDGHEDNFKTSNKQADRSPVDTAISVLRKKLEKYSKCINTVRGIGYKYIGPPKVDKESLTVQSDLSYSHPFNTSDSKKEASIKESTGVTKISNVQQEHVATQASNDTIINLAALIIKRYYKNKPDEDDQIRYSVIDIIKNLEQGLFEEFEITCEQTWAELRAFDKAMKIFQAYKYVTDRLEALSQTDRNTRL